MISLCKLNSTSKRIIFSGLIGNLLESFDIMICIYLAHIVSQAFFSPSTQNKNLLYTFFVFLAGYLSRPLGSLLIGIFADQVGRKKMLVYSLLMTGGCTAIIGLIPSYQTIGVTASILFLFFRILQNISVGGEYISSISYLVESASKHKRGFYGSWVSVGFNGGALLASFLVYIVVSGINHNYLPEWSWRLIFLVAIIGTLLGYWIRISLPESLGYILANSSSRQPSKFTILKSSFFYLKEYPLYCLSLMVISWLGVSETSAIFIYSPIHMATINTLSVQKALEINTLSLLLLTLIIPFFGYLYDRINRLKLLVMTTISFIVLAPMYFYYLSYGSYFQILISKLLFSIPSACYYAVATVLITESFPVSIRCTSLALIYQMVSALAGGLTPIILIYLSQHYHPGWAPAAYIMLSGGFCLLGLSYLYTFRHRQPLAESAEFSLIELT